MLLKFSEMVQKKQQAVAESTNSSNAMCYKFKKLEKISKIGSSKKCVAHQLVACERTYILLNDVTNLKCKLLT